MTIDLLRKLIHDAIITHGQDLLVNRLSLVTLSIPFLLPSILALIDRQQE